MNKIRTKENREEKKKVDKKRRRGRVNFENHEKHKIHANDRFFFLKTCMIIFNVLEYAKGCIYTNIQ